MTENTPNITTMNVHTGRKMIFSSRSLRSIRSVVDETKCESDDAMDFHIQSHIKYNCERAVHLASSRLPLIDITFSEHFFFLSSIFMLDIFIIARAVVVFSSNHQHHHHRRSTHSTLHRVDSSVEIEKSNC